ncbi:Armadillo-like helical domain-containing protein 3 [Mytilus edulis]|uniref:Armadillo-like helical domain-containing protein 3 n=1 Tax=Mytilus edulis TaxID=6550 RepID=A0A8S3RGU7_MYTED|nr:Armadillo-like helical domain-containing protein 3 [Mytilus edulis]
MATEAATDSKRLLRRSSSNKMGLKEKVVQIYEIFFRTTKYISGDDPSCDKPNFWDEFFLLKVNIGHIESEFDKLSNESLLGLKDNLNLLFYKAVQALKEENPIRVINALHTLCALIRGVFKKSVGDFGFDVINILIGFDSAETVMQQMVENLNRILTEEYPVILKLQVLKFLQVLATATDNISQNTLLEYILINSVFESLIQILGNAALRQILGHDTVLVLTLFIQYRKYESANQYIVKLSILDDELALTNGWNRSTKGREKLSTGRHQQFLSGDSANIKTTKMILERIHSWFISNNLKLCDGVLYRVNVINDEEMVTGTTHAEHVPTALEI